MSEFDSDIRRALDADDEAFLRDLEDGRGLFTQMGSTFRGPMGGWTAFGFLVILIATGFGLFGVYKIVTTNEIVPLVRWTAAAAAAWAVQVALKQWVYDRMNTLSILRELKKIEMRIARIEDRG
ncbi:MAG: DUF6768 family protein [Pseudomonadota bacterium]